MLSEPSIRRRVRGWAAAASAACAAFGPLAAVAAPEVGQAAPEFELRGSDGKTYTLASIFSSGKEGVVLAWFPKAFTPG